MLDDKIENTPTENNENTNTSENTPEITDSETVEESVEEIAAVKPEESETADEVADVNSESKETPITDGEPIEESVEEIVAEKPEEKETLDEVADVNSESKETPITDDETIEESVEEIVAEKSEEKETVDEVAIISSKPNETPKADYTTLTLESLVKELQKLLKNESIHHIKNDVEALKTSFNQKFGELLAEKKKAFLDDGGNEIDFQYNIPIKKEYNDLLFEYKVAREKYYKQQKESQAENLTKRLTLIDDLKSLIDNAEPSSMYKHFRELQDKWNVIGKIPHANYNDVWRTYHHHVERFYDLLHLNNDFRDLDFKHNLGEKLKLVDRAEALTKDEDVNRAFKELQVLHRLWKEDVGPVAKEFRDDVWNKFSEATKKIHDKRHEFEKHAESRYEENVVAKEQLIKEIESLIPDAKIDSHSVWQQKIRELEVLRKKFFKIGKVPRAKNEQIWDAFKKATADFNRKKNDFYKNIKKDQHDNLDKKRALVEKAESLKDNEDLNATTPIMKQIQAEWKRIGHVPRKFSDEIWKSFKDACNYYFDRLHNVQDEANKGEIEIFNKKKEMLESLKSQADSNEILSLELIESYADDWNALGVVPFSMRHIESKFNKFVDRLYDKLDLDKNEIAMLRFKNLIHNYMAQKNYRKIEEEQLFVRKKVDEINKEIQQLENNIGFFSSATDDNPLLKNVRDNIDKYVDDLVIWKEKLAYMSKLEY